MSLILDGSGTITGLTSSGVASSSVGYLPAGTGAVATTVQTKLREFTSSADTGTTPRVLIEFQDGAGSGPNIIVNPTINDIADDLSAVTISGGGNSTYKNLVGYQEDTQKFTGDGSTVSFTTSFTVTSTLDVKCIFIRQDKVLIDVTAQCDIVMVGSNANVTYPKPGHFVNDQTGGAEGTNPAMLTTQALRITRVTLTKLTGSGSFYSGISYGYDNIIQSGVMQHASGAHQRVTAGDHNTVFGGSYHRISAGAYGGVFGGFFNEIASSGSGQVIVGGTGNSITTGPGYIFGGSGQTVSAAFGTILGGTGNTVSANGAIATGRSNTVSGADAFCAGGSNTVSATYSVVAGYLHSVSGTGYSAAFGRQNTVSGQYSYAVGYLNTVSASAATAEGRDALADKSFSHVIGGEKFAVLGDAQSTVLVLRRQTTNATPTELRLGSATGRISIPDDTTWAFSVLIVARRTDADNESAAYEIKGCIDRNAGTVALVGTPTYTNIAEDQASWDIAASADNTNKALSITVTGEAAKTINWVARVTLVEVTG